MTVRRRGPVASAGGAGAAGAGAAAADAAGIVRRLGERAQTLAVAESLTGGLLAATIVDVPGASAVFRGGVVVYATDLKGTLAQVPPDLLAERGPVDPDVALAMAAGIRARCQADWALATTGVAGPAEPDGLPAGTVHVALAGPSEPPRVRSLRLAGDRSAVRRGTVAAALALLADALDDGRPLGGAGWDGGGDRAW